MTSMKKRSRKTVSATTANTSGPPNSPLSAGRRLIRNPSNPVFTHFDGTARAPRGIQTEFLEWLRDGWTSANVHAGQIPVGGGKSAIARAVQLATGAHCITPSNVLIDQYIGQYRDVNFLKGKTHYQCFSGLTCTDWVDVMKQPACGSCPYKESRMRAAHEPTFFNPLSLYYFRISQPQRVPVIVVDEAHQLGSMIQRISEKRFRKSLYQWDERCLSEVYLIPWIGRMITKVERLIALYTDAKSFDKVKDLVGEVASLNFVLSGVAEDPQNYAIYTERGTFRSRPDEFLTVRPVRPPARLVRSLLDCDKLVLISGTLFPTDIEDLAGDLTTRFVDLPSPIPAAQRPIFYRPVPFPMNVNTDPALVAAAIEKLLDTLPRQNTLIHVTYSMSKRLIRHFKRPVIANTAESKNAALARFRRDGGVWLAAGCAEGLDLRDDECRLNIIPRLSYPDLGDPVVQKRRALPNGNAWYDLETLKIAIQQAGRSTRHEKDRSTTIIMDPRFSRLVSMHRAKLPQSFLDALVWTP